MNEKLNQHITNFTELLVAYGKYTSGAEELFNDASGQYLIEPTEEHLKQLENYKNFPIVLEEFIPLFLKLQYITEEKIEQE
jgi:hypothetical protein